MTTEGNAPAGAPRFSVGTVISTSLSVLFANIWAFLVVILAVGVPLVVVIMGGSMIMAAGVAGPLETGAGLKLQDLSAASMLFLIFVSVLGVLAYLLIQAAVTYGALQSLRGRRAGIGACISNGLSVLPRVFLAGLLFAVAMAVVGFVVAFVFSMLASVGAAAIAILGGIAMSAIFAFIVVTYWVFVPVIVVEQAGPIDCFTRSKALTKGRRWGIFGILVLVFLANWVISLLGRLLHQVAPAASGLIDILSLLFFMALSAVLAAVGYYFLRAEKEGVAIDDVVTVFD
jgi:hypothetical protein